MNQPKPNQQTLPKPPIPVSNQAPQPIPPPSQHLTDERIKEVIIETLIELNLIPQAQKRKTITIE